MSCSLVMVPVWLLGYRVCTWTLLEDTLVRLLLVAISVSLRFICALRLSFDLWSGYWNFR